MDEPSLHDYIAAIRRRLWVVVAAVLVAVAVAVAVSLVQTPRYRAEAELILRRTPGEQILVDEAGRVRSAEDATRELNNEIRLIESRRVRSAVAEAYDGPLDVDDVEAGIQSDSADVLELSVTATDPGDAARLANDYAETYLTFRRQQQIDDLLTTASEIQSRLDGLDAQIAEISAPIVALDDQIAATTDREVRADLQERRSAEVTRLRPQLAPLQGQQSLYRSQLNQVQVSADITQSGGVQLLDEANEPDRPVSPATLRNLVVAVLVGLIGGLVLALVRDRLDDSVRSKEDGERLTGKPTLGLVPRVGDRRDPPTGLVTLEDPTSAAAEAYRALRTSVKFLGVDQPVRKVLVTSAEPAAGKTVTAANLAIVLAQSGERVLLVGADLRRPRVHELFDVRPSPGLTTLLLGDAEPSAVCRRIAGVPGLSLLPPGPLPPNPSELLDGRSARAMFASLAASYETVVIDSPPVLPVTDAQVLSQMADAVLVVVAHSETSGRGLGRALELLGQVEAPVVGIVLNRVPPQGAYGGQTYRYETYRARRARRPVGEEPGAAAPPRHARRDGAPGDRPVPGDGTAPVHPERVDEAR